MFEKSTRKFLAGSANKEFWELLISALKKEKSLMAKEFNPKQRIRNKPIKEAVVRQNKGSLQKNPFSFPRLAFKTDLPPVIFLAAFDLLKNWNFKIFWSPF